MSSKPKHTPGPWRHHCGRIWSDYVDDGVIVASAGDDHGRVGKDELRANNNLIAAAPDLLAALQNIVGNALWRQPEMAHRQIRNCNAG